MGTQGGRVCGRFMIQQCGQETFLDHVHAIILAGLPSFLLFLCATDILECIALYVAAAALCPPSQGALPQGML